ncbi:homoserine dehydrogenase [Bacillus cereus]|nr:homoserine dehydrogenase [Bacillus cereus]PEZ01879.1 homoserine dehydrogenase [Bacillus cereus]PGP70052.1 homoserine dehydrogenase [Bacillus cereus]
MKRLSFQILMFVFCMIASLILFYVIEKQIYNRITIVDDKQAVLQRVNESLPTEVKVRHEKWGEIVVTDEVRLHTIVSFFDRIRIEPREARNQEQVFTGEVTYLNGHKRTFAVGDLFQYEANVYGKNGTDPMISVLQTYLLSLYYTPERISNFFAEAKEVVVRQGDVIRTIDLTQIFDSIRYAKQITDYGEIQKLLQSQNEPTAYITAYKTGKRVKNEREDILTISVYPSYFVVQYLGDNNGNVMYMKGSLAELFVKENAS